KKYGVPYIYDPGQQSTIISKNDLIEGITGARVLIVNDYELAMVQKKIGFTKKEILERVGMLVTTLGEKGSLIELRNPSQPPLVKGRRGGVMRFRIPAAKVKSVIDPTGAGDAYRAGFIYGLLREWPLEKVGRFASLVSVYTVEKAGTQTHAFTWANLRKRYQKNFSARL
ncbi:MAG: PfkB family carbohydrate kinase, partial [bacterium]|nr:PfkB family carbohydrate kinase [bacterium]